MRKLSRHSIPLAALLCLMFVATVTSSYAQEPISVSTEKIRVNGRLMYAHTVKKGQTIYSICKAYNVTSEQLQEANPALKEGLKEGMLLMVPAAGADGADAASNKNSAASTSKEAPSGQENTPTESRSIFKRIAQALGMSKEDKAQSDKEKRPQSPEADYTTAQNDSYIFGESKTSGNADYVNISDLEIDKSKTRNIALILPLASDGTPNANYMDFYAGALMAVRDVKNAGGNIELTVIDQNKYGSSEELIHSGRLNRADVVIGPIRASNLKDYISFFNDNKVVAVSPLDPAADSYLGSSPYLFQAPVASEELNDDLVAWVRQHSRTVYEPNIVLVCQSDSKDTSNVRKLRQLLDTENLRYSTISYSILQGKQMGGTFSQTIREKQDNIVIVPSNNEAFVSDVLRNLDILELPQGKITVYGTQKWRGFEAVDLSLYYKFSLHLIMPYYVDLSDSKTQEFILQYRALYKNEPSANSFNGYDVTKFFTDRAINGLREYLNAGFVLLDSDHRQLKEFEEKFLHEDMLQQNLYFKRRAAGEGFCNTTATRIIYNPNYTISKDYLRRGNLFLYP